MSWFKNIWDRLFFQDTEEEVNEVAKEQEAAPKAPSKKSPFRFPVITDDEKSKFLKQNPRTGFSTEPLQQEKTKAEALRTAPSKRRPSSPALNKNRRYEPAGSYVQDYTPPNPARPAAQAYETPRTARNVEKAPVPSVPKKPEIKTYEAPKPVKPAKPRSFDTQPIKKTRSFEPGRVPSPIHGYNDSKPTPTINELEKKEIRFYPKKILSTYAQDAIDLKRIKALGQAPDATATPESQTTATPDKQPALQAQASQEPPMTEEASIVQEHPVIEELPEIQNMAIIEDRPIVQPQPEISEQLVPDVPIMVEAQEVKKVSAPAEIAAIEVQETAAEKPNPLKKATKPEGKREKTVPFNVLMLKSDKERLKKPLPPKSPGLESKKEEVVTTEEKPLKKIDVNTQLMSEVIASSKQEESIEPVKAVKEAVPYKRPEIGVLRPPENDLIDETWMEEQGERLIEALSHFQIQASILSIVQGPAVTQFEVTVAQGVKVSKIRNLADDLKLALAAKDIRIQAPIPGKSSIGIEIPNRKSRPVRISEVIGSPVFESSESPLEAALGLDLTGKPVTLDLRKMPHGLIAGATGSGKSVCINSVLISLLYKSSPRDLKLLLIDPKMVELAPYNHIPHLISPVITDVKAATASLKWAVEEMERRYKLFAHVGVRDLNRYNKLVKEKGDHAQHLPYILIIIDELADLMMMSPSDVEDAICRIAQKARACGIHLVIATQRPSVDVITGLIKSNIPTRIAFSVSSQVDSRTILDTQGAERLLGRGDMLYLGNGMSAPVRLQGTFVTDEEIEEVIAHVRKQGEPEYFFKEEELIKRSDSPDMQDDLFEEACRFIISQGSASTSLLQRKFHIGYNRAARLMDMIEQHGFISEQNGSKARAVLITEEDMADVFQ
ncbi:DNA translocase FtsK [Planococcus shenhongbingii]|uniref:DNA translocase FtsK n=1 Tax=Planococcus shenhongbingii TaxID=3058398 RepID=A0ABT8NDR8_9BACL|nr:DNA translocase FtsK [Planococcus sp. N017]MDN7246040.1 DNA translocase FtsK [Planococcus sp. N017]